MTAVRPERTFEQFSRGLELVRAIRKMWEANDRLPRRTWENTLRTNKTIEERTEAIRADFDLTIDEWHYWCRQARPTDDEVDRLYGKGITW